MFKLLYQESVNFSSLRFCPYFPIWLLYLISCRSIKVTYHDNFTSVSFIMELKYSPSQKISQHRKFVSTNSQDQKLWLTIFGLPLNTQLDLLQARSRYHLKLESDEKKSFKSNCLWIPRSIKGNFGQWKMLNFNFNNPLRLDNVRQ